MSLRAEQLCKSIAFLDRRIERTDARVIRLHGGRKCGKHFWCGGYCDRVRELMEIKEENEAELRQALALMAAERIALAQTGLPDDIVRLIVVDYVLNATIPTEEECLRSANTPTQRPASRRSFPCRSSGDLPRAAGG
jgi:hypothetical protein